jgi:hypothetical protein
MRNRILAGVGVAALATVGLAAPAAADSHETSTITVVHGIVGVPVDIYLAGDLEEPLIGEFQPGDIAGPLELPADTYEFVVVGEGTDPTDAANVIFEPSATVPSAGLNITLVAHPDTDGAPVLTPFVNNVDETAAGEGRLSVRHTANFGPVDILAAGDPIDAFSGAENGDGGDIDLPVGTYPAAVAALGETEAAAETLAADVNIQEGVNTLVYAVSDLDGETFSLVVQNITVGAAGVEGIPAGGAGLVVDGNNAGLLGGAAALLIALLAAAGIIARRATVSSK